MSSFLSVHMYFTESRDQCQDTAKIKIDNPAKPRYNDRVAKGNGVMATRGSPKPLLRVRVLLPLPMDPAAVAAGFFVIPRRRKDHYFFLANPI